MKPFIHYSSNFTIEFKTTADTGVLFYVSEEHRDFMAVYLQNGLVHFAFNCGSGAARITSVQTYNDDNWHTVSVL